MKKYTTIMMLFFALIFALSGISVVKAADYNKIVYFYGPNCSGCQGLIDDGYIEQIEDAGIEIMYVNTEEAIMDVYPENVTFELDDDGKSPTSSDVWSAFILFYQAGQNPGTPHMFVGDTDYNESEIREAIDSGEFFEKAKLELLEINVTAGQNYKRTQGIAGFFLVMGSGLLDGFNPCAIALLLLFISLLGFTKDKKILFIVSATYIITMFVSYYLIGLGVLEALRSNVLNSNLANVVSWIILIIVLIFFVLNVYDFMVLRNEEYGKIKSQIPKWLQRFNKRIMRVFTDALSDSHNKSNIARVIGLTFVLGVIMTLTEFSCSGAIYLGILDGIKVFENAYSYVLLLVFNIMFVSPMIVIAFLAIKSQSTRSISNWMREHLHIIKLANALIFLMLAVFFILRLLGVIDML